MILDDPPSSTPTSASAPPIERAARILVVDDEESVAEIFREFLSDQGHELAVASTGEQAVEMIPAFRPDIVLSDINLPGVSGLDVMRFAKSHDPETAVIVVTGNASAATAIDALRQGAYDYITKPFDLDEVHQIVERGLANRQLKAINARLVEELRQKNEILLQHEHQLRERVDKATAQLRSLYEVGLQVGVNLELAPRLGLVCAKSAELCGARAAIVFLTRPENDDCYAAAWHGIDLPAPSEDQVYWLGHDGALAGVLASGSSARHAASVPGAPSAARVAGLSFASWVAVPLVSESQPIGLLAVLDKDGGFTDEDQSFLELFASQIAVAVRNSQLYEHTKSLDRLKSEFVAVVSHEIRTPLTSIKGAVELLGDDRWFTYNAQQTKLLSIAHANTDRLLFLIEDILDFSKLESSALRMAFERQVLAPVIEQAVNHLRTQVEEHRIDLELDLDPDLPEVMIDARRIVQVLTNLLSNAIKFSPPGGRIEVQARRIDDGVRVAVRDHGEGIAAADLAKLFRKFSQIDSTSTRQAGGVGLGLVISKGLIDQHGGKIWVESHPGVGSTFHFTLPSATHAAEPART